MGWRSTGAAFRAGNYKGPLTSDEGGFASGFATTFAAGISKAADIFADEKQAEREQERAKDLIRLRETLAAQRAAASRSNRANSENEDAITDAREWAVSSLESSGLPATPANIQAAMGLYTIEGTDVQRGNAFSSALSDGIFETTGSTGAAPAASPPTVPEAAAAPAADLPDRTNTPAYPLGTPVDDLEATEDLTPTRSSMPTAVPEIPRAAPTDTPDAALISASASVEDMPVARPAVYRPERDEAEIVEAQTVVGSSGVRLSFGTALPTSEATSAAPPPPGVLEVPEPSRMTQAERSFMVNVSKMSRDDLASRLANETDPTYRRILANAYEARLENEFMGLEEGDLMVAARSENDIVRDAAGRILEARREVDALLAGDPERVLADLTTPEQVESQMLVTRNNPDLPDGTKTALLEILQGHQQRLIDLKTPAEQGVKLADVRATNYQALSAQAEANGNISLAQQILEVGQQMASSSPEAAAVLGEVSGILSRANAPVDEARGAVSGYIGAADSAFRMTQIVARNPDILTFFGGRVPAILSRIEGELYSMSGLFSGERTEVLDTDMGAYIDSLQAEAESLFTNGQIDAASRDYAMYRAQEARLAYMIVRSQQGQGGVISNQDYNSALEQVRSSTNAGTFEDSLRQLIRADEVRVSSAVDAIRNNDQIRIADAILKQSGVDFPLVQDITRPLSDTANAYGAGEAYNWLQGSVTLAEGVSLPAAPDDPTTGTSTTPVEPTGSSIEELVSRYRKGESITVTEELAAQYPSLRNRVGQTIRLPTTD